MMRFLSLLLSLAVLACAGWAVWAQSPSGMAPKSASNGPAAVKPMVGSPVMVFFTASWCAACREVIPIAQNVASQYQYTIQIVDVESASAVERAKTFGLTIPKKTLPQVYLMTSTPPTLIYDGTLHPFGDPPAIRELLLEGLPQ